MRTSLEAWTQGGQRISIAGRRIFVRQDGPPSGGPVTLLHGFPTSSHDWSLIVPALADAGLRVTTLDFLGFGASDKPAHHDYRLTEQADIVEAIWAELRIDRTDLVAHDYGDSVAQELVARNASRITRTVWLNGGLYPDLHRPIPIQRLLHSPLGRFVAPLVSEWTFTRALHNIMGQPYRDPELMRNMLHDMWTGASSQGGPRVQWQLLRYIDERREHAERWRQALESYPGPTLFIWGPADPISGAHVLKRLQERMPQAGFAVLDQPPITGHYPQVENPEAVATECVAFLKGH